MLKHTKGIIYFIQASIYGPVKIGIVKNKFRLKMRLQDFQIGHYEELSIIRTINGTLLTEKWLHHRYFEKGDHLKGEWFRFNLDMLEIIPPSHEEIIMINFPKLQFRTIRINFEEKKEKNSIFSPRSNKLEEDMKTIFSKSLYIDRLKSVGRDI